MDKNKVKEETLKLFKQLTNGCSRSICYNSACAKFHSKTDTLSQKDALAEALKLINTNRTADCFPSNQFVLPSGEPFESYFNSLLPEVAQFNLQPFCFGDSAAISDDFLMILEYDYSENFSNFSESNQNYILFFYLTCLIRFFLGENYDTDSQLISHFCLLISKLVSKNQKQSFINFLLVNLVPETIVSIVGSVHNFTIVSFNDNLEEKLICPFFAFLRIINDTGLVNSSFFYADVINTNFDKLLNSIKQNLKMNELSEYSVLAYPFVLNELTKLKLFNLRNFGVIDITSGPTSLAAALATASKEKFIAVDRDNMLQQTMNILAGDSKALRKKKLTVIMKNEQGIDQGGVKKEYFGLVFKEFFETNSYLFSVREGCLWFFPTYEFGQESLIALGKLFALVLLNNMTVEPVFPSIFYKLLLCKKATFDDLQAFDAGLYKQLVCLKEDMDLNFTIDIDNFGNVETVELIENGCKVQVTAENLREYIELYSDFLLNKLSAEAMNLIRKGFYEIIDENDLALFSAEEFEKVMVGDSKVKFEELRNGCQYKGYKKESNYIGQFWEIVLGLNEENKKKFLKFISGSSRIPVGGMTITIFHTDEKNKLPSSSTCSNYLILPKYDSVEILKEKLELAIQNCEGFGLL